MSDESNLEQMIALARRIVRHEPVPRVPVEITILSLAHTVVHLADMKLPPKVLPSLVASKEGLTSKD